MSLQRVTAELGKPQHSPAGQGHFPPQRKLSQTDKHGTDPGRAVGLALPSSTGSLAQWYLGF